MSKVQELLRQSRESAFNLNKEDIDKKFNFKTNQNQCFAELIDDVGKPFVEKIISIRDQQKALLPLYMESKSMVQKH